MLFVAPTVDELRRELETVESRLGQIRAEHGWSPQPPDLASEHDALDRRVRPLRRAIAQADGREAAVEIDWPVQWETGAPVPTAYASGRRTFLIYLVALRPPSPAGYDPSEVHTIDESDDRVEKLAIVEFHDCDALRFGRPNDEGLDHHPLYEAGLTSYAAHVVENSRWLAACRAIDSFRADDDPNRWDDHKHYLLTFHDELFECLATGFSVEIIQASFADAARIARSRL